MLTVAFRLAATAPRRIGVVARGLLAGGATSASGLLRKCVAAGVGLPWSPSGVDPIPWTG